MAAVLAPVPSSRPFAPRPTLRVLPGGRSVRSTPLASTPSASTYRRRRLVAATLALAAAAVVALVATYGLSSLATSTTLATATSPAAVATSAGPSPAEVYVVQPGDTLWAIAQHLGSSGDVRALVDELADRSGGAVLQPGQRLDLRGLVG
jgi:LysM repeat protein